MSQPQVPQTFWTDGLKSLELSYELLFDEAWMMNARMKEFAPDYHIADLEDRIAEVRRGTA